MSVPENYERQTSKALIGCGSQVTAASGTNTP